MTANGCDEYATVKRQTPCRQGCSGFSVASMRSDNQGVCYTWPTDELGLQIGKCQSIVAFVTFINALTLMKKRATWAPMRACPPVFVALQMTIRYLVSCNQLTPSLPGIGLRALRALPWP
jgi:hypothetical protein